MKRATKSQYLYHFSPLISRDGDKGYENRCHFMINEDDLAKVCKREATMVDVRSGKSFKVQKIKGKRGDADDHVLVPAD
jgi:hypothetical protein